MIYTLQDLVGHESVKSSVDGKRWCRAVPLQFFSGTLQAAWAVFCGRAVAVYYPENGELETSLAKTGGLHVNPPL